MEINTNKSIQNNSENQKLLLKEVDESIFNNSLYKKKFGLLELHISIEQVYSHYDFIKTFRALYSKTKGIKSIDIDENHYKVYIIFNPKKISLKEILKNILDLGYQPVPLKYKPRTKKHNSYSSEMFNVFFDTLSSISSIFVSIGDAIVNILYIFKR